MTRRRFRRTFAVIFIVASIIVAMIPVSGATAETTVSAPSEFMLDGTTLVKYTGTASTVSVPATVKIIGEEAFVDNSNLKVLKLPDTVEEIGYAAFSGCNNLTEINIPDSVEVIGTAAFCNCTSLTKVRVGKNVKKLGTGIFVGCKDLTDVSLSASGNDHFVCDDGVIYDTDKTTIVEVLQGRKANNYTMPASVTDIYPYAFYGCKNINTVNFSSKLSEIPAYSFSNCNGLSKVNLTYSIDAIDMKAFENCVNLTDVDIPISVIRIHETAFDGCPRLNVIAPENSYAYNWFKNYKPDNAAITDDEDNSDKKNDGDKEKEPPKIEIEGLIGETIIVGRQAVFFIDNSKQSVLGSDASPKNTDYSDEIAQMENVLQAETNGKGLSLPKFAVIGKTIAAKAFYGNTELSSYEITDDITSIGDFAFARSKLTSIKIPESVTHIGYGAFYHCDELVQVLIPVTVTDIEPSAFAHSRMLENWLAYGDDDFLIMGDGILVAYRGHGSHVEIPDSVKQIGPEAFKDHKEITEVSIPDSVFRICEDAFNGCKNLTTVSGGMHVEIIEDRAFYACPVGTVRIVDSVKSIGLGAFELDKTSMDEAYKVAVFQGDTLPAVTYNKTSTRLSNGAYRIDALAGVKVAVVNSESVNRAGTVLDRELSGFSGLICTVIDENNEYFNGTLHIIDCTLTADEARNFYIPDTVYIYGKGYNLRPAELDSLFEMAASGAYGRSEEERTPVFFQGSNEEYILTVSNDSTPDNGIKEAYKRIYGDSVPQNLSTFEIDLRPSGSEVLLTKFGKQTLYYAMAVPSNVPTSNLHVICSDEDGQMEDLPYKVVNDNGSLKLTFELSHTGKYGVYAYSSESASSLNLDSTPDTGDPIHPKWFLALGLFAIGIAWFVSAGKRFTGV